MNSIELARNVRRDTLLMTSRAGASHIGSIFSITDIVSVLYANVMKYDVKNPNSSDRDRFILSKGHAGACVYATLAELGFFDKSKLDTYYSAEGTSLSGHVSHKNNPGVEFSTGSLGHGASVAVGMALAGKLDNKNYKVYSLVGNGECNEGSIWEAIMVAVQQKLDNFVMIVDFNNLQCMGNSEQIINLNNLAERFKSFGACVVETDGHNHKKLYKALTVKSKGKPVVVIAHTVKGKGVSFMENNNDYHSKVVKDEFLTKALEEIGGK